MNRKMLVFSLLAVLIVGVGAGLVARWLSHGPPESMMHVDELRLRIDRADQIVCHAADRQGEIERTSVLRPLLSRVVCVDRMVPPRGKGPTATVITLQGDEAHTLFVLKWQPPVLSFEGQNFRLTDDEFRELSTCSKPE